MSKNITIKEGGTAKQLTVDKLKTNLVSSGTCLWVPEDEVQLTTKTITQNGTYKASDDGYYGYSEVTVSGIGTATGTDEDGDEAIVTTGEGGELEETKVPSSIEVDTPPTVSGGIYTNGQTITKDGMIVKAYLLSGNLYDTEDYPGGVVPNGEITLDPTTAVYDPTTDTGGGESADIDDPAYAGYHPPIIAYHELITTDDHKMNPKVLFRKFANSSAFLVPYYVDGITLRPTYLWVSTSQNDAVSLETHVLEDGQEERVYYDTISLQYSSTTNISSTTFYYGYGGNLGLGSEEASIPAYVFGPGVRLDDVYRDVATILIDGTITPIQAGSRQEIGVFWPRPIDGNVLETTFEILVAPPYGGEGEGEGGAGGVPIYIDP